MNWTQGLLVLNLAAMLFLSFTVINDDPVTVEKELVNVSTERPTYNLTCPEPEVKQPNVTVQSYPGNIQNPELDTRTSMAGSSFEIHNVDVYGELYGSSMSPSIMDGDTVVSEEYTGQKLEEGMIIRYRKDSGEPRIHRVVGDYTVEGYVIVSGDRVDKREKVNLDDVTHIVKAVVYG